MNSIAVFCGSGPGNDKSFSQEAYGLGQLLARDGVRLVYGGSKNGIMGCVADGVLDAGGQVTGVIPEFMKKKEIVHTGLTDLVTTENMHQRKLIMNERSDGFIALPGGYGTLEELFEIITWSQLGLHHKPVGVLNCGGYYDPLFTLLDHMVSKELLRPQNRSMLLQSASKQELLTQMRTWKADDARIRITKDRV